MKALLLFLALIPGLASAAPAPVECYKQAIALSSVTTEAIAAKVCQGARSTAPVECYKAAIALSSVTTEDVAATLCQGTL